MTRKPWEKMSVEEMARRFAGDNCDRIGDYFSGPIANECPRCHESRCVSATAIGEHVTLYCEICSTHWDPDQAEILYAP